MKYNSEVFYTNFEKILKKYRKQYESEYSDEFDFSAGDVYGAPDSDYHSLNHDNPQRTIKRKLRPGMQLFDAAPNQKEILLLPGTGRKHPEDEAFLITTDECPFLLKNTYFLYHLDMYLLKRKIKKYFGSVPTHLLTQIQNKFESIKKEQGEF